MSIFEKDLYGNEIWICQIRQNKSNKMLNTEYLKTADNFVFLFVCFLKFKLAQIFF